MNLDRTPLSEVEKAIVRKLATARYPPATASKRFVRDLSSGYVRDLSERGRAFLAFVAHRFRRQYRLDAGELAWVEKHMPHHFQKGIDETWEFCGKCNRQTRHIVSNGRLGRCKEHEITDSTGMTKEQQRKAKQREFERKNPTLF